MIVTPLGDKALVVQLGERIDGATFAAVQALSRRLEQHGVPGMVEYVPAFTSMTIYYDPLQVSFAEVCAAVETSTATLDTAGAALGRTVEIPVCYGGEFGSDLEFVANEHGLSAAEVIAIHSGAEYLVHMIGFAPGFPYLGGLPETIATPRKATPRLKVPAGSVGIAGAQTGIYPLETPGGWQIIGRTPLAMFNAMSDPPSLLQAADRVRFTPITPEEFQVLQARPR